MIAGLTAEDIRKIRASLGLTQEGLAKRLRVTWRTIARWEAGDKIPYAISLALREVQRQEKAS